MKLHDVKLLTIICEVYIHRKVLDIIEKHKVRGYTVSDVGGKGESGMRGTGLPGESNVKIETIVKNEKAEKIIEELTLTILPDHVIIIYMLDTKVVRAEKFS